MFLFQLKALQEIEENDPDAEPWSDPVEWAKAMVSTLRLLGLLATVPRLH